MLKIRDNVSIPCELDDGFGNTEAVIELALVTIYPDRVRETWKVVWYDSSGKTLQMKFPEDLEPREFSLVHDTIEMWKFDQAERAFGGAK